MLTALRGELRMTESAGTAGPGQWPELDLSDWGDTRDTLHMWLQVIGKIRLELTPLINHWWNVPLYVSSRGLTTSLMHVDGRGLEIEFDFIDQALVLRTTDGESRHIRLEPQSVAAFHRSTMATLGELGIDVRIDVRPSEVVEAIRFDQDEEHRAYDGDAVQHLWQALVQVERVLTDFRARFIGKASPVHLFWGGADLCTTRFSGRPAPKHRGGVPNCPDSVQVLAYSHEVSSAGFWPGSDEAIFYAYAYPEPAGFAEWAVEPVAARYETQLGEFVLPYSAIQTAPDPDSTLLAFLQSTYEAAAELGHWDRAALEWDQIRG
jgi:hypothetical protein